MSKLLKQHAALKRKVAQKVEDLRRTEALIALVRPEMEADPAMTLGDWMRKHLGEHGALHWDSREGRWRFEH